jgi:hypothetical protein
LLCLRSAPPTDHDGWRKIDINKIEGKNGTEDRFTEKGKTSPVSVPFDYRGLAVGAGLLRPLKLRSRRKIKMQPIKASEIAG